MSGLFRIGQRIAFGLHGSELRRSGIEHSAGDLIDHLLMKRFPKSWSTVTRAFTAPVSIATISGTVMTNLSDHYGIRLTISSTQ